MKNVTISLDDSIHRRARIRAAEAGKSLSGLVRDLLENLDRRGGAEEILPSDTARSESERRGEAERKLREHLAELRKQVPEGFRASDRLDRDAIHDRARVREGESRP